MHQVAPPCQLDMSSHLCHLAPSLLLYGSISLELHLQNLHLLRHLCPGQHLWTTSVLSHEPNPEATEILHGFTGSVVDHKQREGCTPVTTTQKLLRGIVAEAGLGGVHSCSLNRRDHLKQRVWQKQGCGFGSSLGPTSHTSLVQTLPWGLNIFLNPLGI